MLLTIRHYGFVILSSFGIRHFGRVAAVAGAPRTVFEVIVPLLSIVVTVLFVVVLPLASMAGSSVVIFSVICCLKSREENMPNAES